MDRRQSIAAAEFLPLFRADVGSLRPGLFSFRRQFNLLRADGPTLSTWVTLGLIVLFVGLILWKGESSSSIEMGDSSGDGESFRTKRENPRPRSPGFPLKAANAHARCHDQKSNWAVPSSKSTEPLSPVSSMKKRPMFVPSSSKRMLRSSPRRESFAVMVPIGFERPESKSVIKL